MSASYYGKMWITAKKDLDDVLIREKIMQSLNPINDRPLAHRIFASLYARYIILVNNLGEIYDQTLQVQKREVVENILINATLRLRELEIELKNIEISEFVYIDQTLIEMKFIPQEVRYVRPFYFPLERTKEIQDIVDGVRPKREPTEEEIRKKEEELAKLPKMLRMTYVEPSEEELKANEVKKIFVDAVDLIKIHEKARQARELRLNYKTNPELFHPIPYPGPPEIVYEFHAKPDDRQFKIVKRTKYRDDFYLTDIKQKSNFKLYACPQWRCPRDPSHLIDYENLFDVIKIPEKKKKVEEVDETIAVVESPEHIAMLNAAAWVIQRAWLHYKIRVLVEKRKIKRRMLLNMAEPRNWDHSLYDNIEKNMKIRRARKPEFDEAFIQTCLDIKARILKIKSPWIMEDISDQIRFWFREWYDNFGTFDRYPDEWQGGTILVIKGETKSIEEYAQYLQNKAIDALKSPDQKKAEAQQKKALKAKEKEKRKKEKQKKKKLQLARKKMEEKQGKTWYFDDSDFITKNFLKLDKSMEEYEREWRFVNELNNLKEAPYEDWITLDKYSEVHQELRLIVDEMMRIEFELLRMSLAKDKKKKYKPQKAKKQRKKRGGKNRKKVPKDETGDRPLYELFDELKNANIIQTYTARSLDTFVGDLNNCAYELRNLYDLNPMHCCGDIIQVIRGAITGLGPLNLSKSKSMLIVGQKLCGKKFLMEAICTEIDAVLFNLSPEVAGQYEDLDYLYRLIVKMSRILQPSVIFVNNVQKVFYSKIPKNEKTLPNPTRLKTMFPKLLKQIKQNDKIMLIGSAIEPWKGQFGKLKKCFEKVILMPLTDYGSMLLMWREMCLSKMGFDRLFDFSSLSIVTKGFSTGSIKETVDRVIDIRRRMSLSREEVRPMELVEGLLVGSPYEFPLNEMDFAKYNKWYAKIDKLAKKRAKAEKIKAELREKEEKKNKKK